MRNIAIMVINPRAIREAEDMMVCAARLTQRGHKIQNMSDFIKLFNKPYTKDTTDIMAHLPHPTIQKFAVINVVIVGASRRFLAQITRHQNEVKFMSASLQYSDYSDDADFVVPYSLLDDNTNRTAYIESCKDAMENYQAAILSGVNNDEAGYMAPQGLRNVLIISATPYQWKHMISQRVCARNTTETRYVMLKIWEQLYNINPILFATDLCGMPCCREGCKEGKFSCGQSYKGFKTPTDILKQDFKKLYKGD